MNTNTSNHAEDLAGFEPETQKKYLHKGCLVEGCQNDRFKPGHGRGMCPKHYRQVLRTGDITHKLPRYREALADASLALAAAPLDREAQWTLAEAAVNLGGALRFRAPRWEVIAEGVRAAIAGEAFGALAGAALMYAEHPTDDESDATFPAVRDALHDAARAFSRPFNLDAIRRAA